MKQIFAALLLTLFSFTAFASGPVHDTAAGTWRTFDDKTKKPKGEVEIYEEGGLYYGKIGKSLDPADKSKTHCTPCKGEFKDQLLTGMRFMWGFKRNGDKYTNGKILDPDSGDIYSATMHLKDNGNTLILRGYLGIPLFGRSQTWERVK
jgi:uncharacterized protein (DUF2147 family)